MNKLVCFTAISLAATFLAGCASTANAPKVAEQKVVTQNYKWVYVTGSHIPVAVPTSADVTGLATISPMTIVTPEEMHHWGGPMH